MSKRNKLYESLIEKSIGSMLSSVEIYNKPDFKYREESFAILAINAWELLLKARIFKLSDYKQTSIYCYKPYTSKTGEKSKKKKVIDRNRTGNPKSISVSDAIKRLLNKNGLPKIVADNIESIIELRDNAIHFVNTSSITIQIQELGFACIKNYVAIFKKWYPRHDLSKYNLYLMPLAYVDAKRIVSSAITKEEQNFLRYVKGKLDSTENNDEYDIAIKIELSFHKGNSFDGAPVKFDKEGLPIALSEEEIRKRFPWSYKELKNKCKSRYNNDFKFGKDFNAIMKNIKTERKYCYHRKLDSINPRSQGQWFL